MKNKQFKFKENAMQFDIDPQIAGEEIEKIKTLNDGKCKPEDVVSVASNPDNPLHNVFDWDNASAANKHRLQIARILIGSIVVTYKHHEEVRANYSVKYNTPEKEGERAYVGIEEAVKPDYELQFRKEACNHLKVFVKRYQSFDYLESEVDQVINIITQMTGDIKKFEDELAVVALPANIQNN